VTGGPGADGGGRRFLLTGVVSRYALEPAWNREELAGNLERMVWAHKKPGLRLVFPQRQLENKSLTLTVVYAKPDDVSRIADACRHAERPPRATRQHSCQIVHNAVAPYHSAPRNEVLPNWIFRVFWISSF
jgi:hypothetical protein